MNGRRGYGAHPEEGRPEVQGSRRQALEPGSVGLDLALHQEL